MFSIGDEVSLNGKKGRIAWVHSYTTYNGLAKGERTAARVRFNDGSEQEIKDLYRSEVEKVKKSH